jgi:hypothetical protein
LSEYLEYKICCQIVHQLHFGQKKTKTEVVKQVGAFCAALSCEVVKNDLQLDTIFLRGHSDGFGDESKIYPWHYAMVKLMFSSTHSRIRI